MCAVCAVSVRFEPYLPKRSYMKSRFMVWNSPFGSTFCLSFYINVGHVFRFQTEQGKIEPFQVCLFFLFFFLFSFSRCCNDLTCSYRQVWAKRVKSEKHSDQGIYCLSFLLHHYWHCSYVEIITELISGVKVFRIFISYLANVQTFACSSKTM